MSAPLDTAASLELKRRSAVMALARCILPALDAGHVTPALRHQVQRLAATYDGAFAARLTDALVRCDPAPDAPKIVRSRLGTGPGELCTGCGCLLSLHDDDGCHVQWGGFNDRQFCDCERPNPGNVVPSQWGGDET